MKKKRFAGLLAALPVALLLTASTANGENTQYGLSARGSWVNPPNASPGGGGGSLLYDDVAHTLQLVVGFGGLTGTVTGVHFHGPTSVPWFPDPGENWDKARTETPNAGIAIGNPSLPGFPLGVTQGQYLMLLDMTQTSIYSAEFLASNGGTAAGAEAAFANLMATGRTYWDIHTSAFGDGEVRGFPEVPEPASVWLALVGLSFLQLRRRVQ
jgi:hypothetical protein